MKSINHEQLDSMVFWVDCIGKLCNILFIDNQDIFFALEPLSMGPVYYHVCSVTDDDYFSDFPVHNWVASFMVNAFHGSVILQ